MKIRKNLTSLVTLLALVLLAFSAFAPAASAASTIPANYNRASKVYVDGVQVNDTELYISPDKTVYIYRQSDLGKLFPAQCGDMSFATVLELKKLTETLENYRLDYSVRAEGRNVYINKNDMHILPVTSPITVGDGSNAASNNNQNIISAGDGSTNTIIDNSTTINVFGDNNNITVNKGGETSTPVEDNSAHVVVNDMAVSDANCYFDRNDGEIKLTTTASLSDIFVGKTIPAYSTVNSMNLRNWAAHFGYTYNQLGKVAYLRNDGGKSLQIKLDGKAVLFPDQQPVVRDNRTLVPVRGLSEALGWTVTYSNGIATIEKGDKSVMFKLNDNHYWVNGTAHQMDVNAQIINNRTMVPIRFAAESLGLSVEFQAGSGVNTVMMWSTR